MVPPLAPAQVGAEFARLLHQVSTETGRLQRGVELAVRMVAGCDHASVTVLTPQYVETVAASDEIVRRGDVWQYDLSEGPSLDSVRGRETVVSQDLRDDPRWRSWGPLAANGLGVRAMMSVVTWMCSSVMSKEYGELRIASWKSSRLIWLLKIVSRTYFSATDGLSMKVRVASTKQRMNLSATARRSR